MSTPLKPSVLKLVVCSLLCVAMAGWSGPRADAAQRFAASAKATAGASVAFKNGLRVAGIKRLQGSFGLRAGDRVVAVNGVQVSSEAAFWNRVRMSGGKARITVARNGRLQVIGAVAPQPVAPPISRQVASRGGGFGIMNPALMVMTSQGVMHRDAAARLGLPGTPITGTPEWPHEHP